MQQAEVCSRGVRRSLQVQAAGTAVDSRLQAARKELQATHDHSKSLSHCFKHHSCMERAGGLSTKFACHDLTHDRAASPEMR